MVRVVGIVLALIIGIAGYWYLLPRSASFGMFEGGDQANLLRLLLGFAATLVGVAFGSVFRGLGRLKANGVTTIENPRTFASETLRSIDLWLGLAGSPIVYALLLQSTNGMSLAGLLVIALQNGFCCLVLINQFVASKERPAEPDDATASKR